MEVQKKTRIFQAAAFGAFTLCILPEIVAMLRYSGNRNLWNVILTLGFILMAVGTLLGNTKLLSLGASIELALSVDSVIRVFTNYYDNYVNPLLFCVRIAFWLLFIIACAKSSKAITLCGVAVVIYIIGYLAITGRLAVEGIVECVAIAFSGIALKGSFKSLVTNSPPSVQRNNALPTNQYENLTKLKELLDAGAITQEEFDEKKTQILGL